MTLPAHNIADHSYNKPKVRPDYLGQRLTYFEWLCMKPRAIGHVSDLLMCMRQRVFQKLSPSKPTLKQMNYYSSGGSMHSKNQEMQASDPGAFISEYKLFYKGLSGSVDVYDRVNNIPLEYKTPRKDGPLREPQSYNLEQLKTYMSILGSDSGYLEYQFVTANRRSIDYQFFWIDMDANEREHQLEVMLSKLANLREGVDNEEPALTEGVWDDPSMNWLCKDCPYKEPCEGMR